MPENEDPFVELIGLWISHISMGGSNGGIGLLADDQLHEEERSYDYRVLLNGITSSRWDRKGTEPRRINRDLTVQGRLERVERSGNTWLLTGTFGEFEFAAQDVHRNDIDWHSEPPPVPALDVEPPHACEAMVRALADEDDGMLYVPEFREYGYECVVGDEHNTISHCPFCGAELPPSMRDAWFARVRELGLDPEVDDVPEAMQSDRWWRPAEASAAKPERPLGI